MKTFVLPDLGEGLHDATIIEWYATEQQTLKQGERLLAVETAKAVVEIPAPEELTISQILALPNTIATVGMPLLDYEAVTAATPASVSVVGVLSEADQHHPQHAFVIGARRFNATEIAAAEARLQAPTSALARQPLNTSAEPTLTLSGNRLSMSRQLTLAHQQVALVTLFDEVAVNWPAHTRPLPRLIQAVCHACQAETKLNAWFDGEQLSIKSEINLGLAVNSRHGLFVPVIRAAQSLTSKALRKQIAALQQAAEERTLSPDQLQGATISLSNFGMLAGRFATPMVVPPQVAIIGVGRIERKALPGRKGKLKTRTVIPLSLSFDHRALTGGEAAAFMAALMQALQKK